ADAGHVHVDQCDIRIQSFDACQAWRAIIGFGDHFHVRLLVDDQAQTGAYQRMVVDQYDSDHSCSPLILPVAQRYCATALRTSGGCALRAMKTYTWTSIAQTNGAEGRNAVRRPQCSQPGLLANSEVAERARCYSIRP